MGFSFVFAGIDGIEGDSEVVGDSGAVDGIGDHTVRIPQQVKKLDRTAVISHLNPGDMDGNKRIDEEYSFSACEVKHGFLKFQGFHGIFQQRINENVAF